MDPRVREMIDAKKAALREKRKELQSPDLHAFVARRAELELLLEDIEKHEYLGKSQPPIDLRFLEMLRNTWDIETIRDKFQKLNRWIASNPDKARNRKNWRRVVNHFFTEYKNTWQKN
jgi:hypothetical protein